MVTKEKTCQMEFYFKRKDIEKLLKAHPDSDIIIRHAVIPQVLKDKTVVNVSKIEAYASPQHSAKGLKADNNGGAELEVIDGCPFPPGC